MEWERKSLAEKKQFIRETKKLQVERDNIISNANLKGKTLDSLGSKESMKTQIKVRFIVPIFLVPIRVQKGQHVL